VVEDPWFGAFAMVLFWIGGCATVGKFEDNVNVYVACAPEMTSVRSVITPAAFVTTSRQPLMRSKKLLTRFVIIILEMAVSLLRTSCVNRSGSVVLIPDVILTAFWSYAAIKMSVVLKLFPVVASIL
jgi:hypothetical protein